MGTEAHVINLHLNVDNFVVNRDLLLAVQNFVANGSRHAVTWDDHRVFLVWGPLFESLER